MILKIAHKLCVIAMFCFVDIGVIQMDVRAPVCLLATRQTAMSGTCKVSRVQLQPRLSLCIFETDHLQSAIHWEVYDDSFSYIKYDKYFLAEFQPLFSILPLKIKSCFFSRKSKKVLYTVVYKV